MAIARYENLTVNNLAFGVSAFGEQSTTQTAWFATRGKISNVSNSVKIADKYRMYQDLVHITLNYTPNTQQIVDDQNLYSITWRGNDWRITDIRESNDRMNITLLCYRADPVVAV